MHAALTPGALWTEGQASSRWLAADRYGANDCGRAGLPECAAQLLAEAGHPAHGRLPCLTDRRGRDLY
ncbi:Chromosome segregation ATPase [Giardia duodenalis assemblage B]|uniref:Chromosome segregation ATPase n=1 Tax=Giardia duodenalis assemblage B TaxID=1394984 RepID=A0A132NM38_GIAIN|nr:Chromosome segregation ATPase [Giardia intestinalis assemblage B]